ncbi:hypothetical protein [Planomonospora algeriensis]
MGELVEDFNDTSYVVSFSGDWFRTTGTVYTTPRGAGCFRSADIGDNATSETRVTVPAGASKVRFWYRVSSEATYDKFFFLINGAEKTEVTSAGDVPWTQSPEFDVAPGNTLTFRYSKDGSGSPSDDAAFIDDLTFVVDDAPVRVLANTAAAVARASRW